MAGGPAGLCFGATKVLTHAVRIQEEERGWTLASGAVSEVALANRRRRDATEMVVPAAQLVSPGLCIFLVGTSEAKRPSDRCRSRQTGSACAVPGHHTSGRRWWE